MKKISALIFAALISVSGMGYVYADAAADDAAWVAKCVKDNADQGQSVEVTSAYCTCMNGKMSSSETQSVTTWEKTHKAESDDCSKQAGWK